MYHARLRLNDDGLNSRPASHEQSWFILLLGLRDMHLFVLLLLVTLMGQMPFVVQIAAFISCNIVAGHTTPRPVLSPVRAPVPSPPRPAELPPLQFPPRLPDPRHLPHPRPCLLLLDEGSLDRSNPLLPDTFRREDSHATSSSSVRLRLTMLFPALRLILLKVHLGP
jgi:hypothetical protein